MFVHGYFNYKKNIKSSALVILALFTSATFAKELNFKQQVYSSTYRNTATKNALPMEKTPQGITVVDAMDLQQRAAKSTSEALRYVSGVNTQLRGAAVSRFDLFTVRGFANQNLYYDGLPLFYNTWNLQPQLDAALLSKVEIFKGPTSVLYGQMPPGGMVNLISFKPSANSYNKLQFDFGTQRLARLGLSSKGALNSALNYSLVALGSKQDSAANTALEERVLLAPQLDVELGSSTLLNFNLVYQKDPETGIFNTLPASGLFLPNPNGKIKKNAYAGDAALNKYQRDVLMLGYKLNHQFSKNITFLQNLRYTDAKLYHENTYSRPLAADRATLARNAYMTDENLSAIAVDNQFSGRFMLAGSRHDLLVGVDFAKYNSNIKYEDVAIAGINIFKPNNRLINRATISFKNTAYSSDFEREEKQLGVYLQDQISIDNLVVMLGLRHDNYHGREWGKKYNAQAKSTTEHYTLTGRVGALYQFDNNVAPYINFAQGFEPQTGKDRAGKEFDVSKSEQIELGIKFLKSDKKLELNSSLFQIIKSNVPTRDPAGSAYDKIQTGEITAKGIEIALNQQLGEAWGLLANLTYQDVEISKDNAGLKGKTPVRTPDVLASLWASYDFLEGALAGTRLAVGSRHLGKAQIDAQNSSKVPSATMFDMAISHSFESLAGLDFNLVVNNIADKANYSCFDADNCWLGGGRVVRASVAYQF